MLKLWNEENKLILSYTPEINEEKDWVSEELEREGVVSFKKTFDFQKDQLFKLPKENDKDEQNFDDFLPDPVHFVLGELAGEYYKIGRGILVNNIDIYIHKEIDIKPTFFTADSKISIFGIIAKLTNQDFYLGGDHPNAVPIEGFKILLSKFPNTYEKQRYTQARVSSVLRAYMDNIVDAEAKFHKYMNKKLTYKGADLLKTFREFELQKYEAILEKLHSMLKKENTYSEKQWQEEILQILFLLYPKYITVFREVTFKADNLLDRSLDYLLVDSNGHVDIIEIKKPFEKSIITQGKYRNNFIPLRELSGTIMQLEKYIYSLNRLGPTGEAKLTAKYKDQLPESLTIKITNPGGIIIMGREDNLTDEQKLDFEVVKRKYKNVVDIITYDNLLIRLGYIIEQLKKN